MKTKICNTCGKEKPLSEFYVNHRDKNGNPISYRGECKSCHNELEKGRY